MASHSRDGERGQVLLLFVFLVVGMLFMAALLFDGANALVNRRVLQNAADAGALEGANALQTGTPKGCNGGAGSTPRASVGTAAENAVVANLGGFAVTSIEVSCPTGSTYNDQAVQVTISAASPSFFAGVLSLTGSPATGITVGGSGTAINGTKSSGGSGLSVAMLNPHRPDFQSQKGCPSFSLNGGPTVKFHGGLQVNSACPPTGPNNAAITASGGGSGTVTFDTSNPISRASVVGGYAGAISWTPLPQTGVAPVPDPLAGLPALNISAMPVRSNTTLSFSNAIPFRVLEPGVYKGGINMGASYAAVMLPGIYIMQGGGLNLGGQASLYAVNPCADGGILCYLATTVTPTTWTSHCTGAECGVMIFNTGSTVGGSGMGPISIGGQGNVRLRSYRGDSDLDPYSRLLIWQDALPVPGGTNQTTQPTVSLAGGGSVFLNGTVYAPSAQVYMTGGSGGGGGSLDTNLTLQFISYDLQLNGNTAFEFQYVASEFAKVQVAQYGLIADPSN